jgi:hypothetical protein
MAITKEERAARFEYKNERRRICKQRNPGQYHEGRRNRATFAVGGAFSNEVVRIYNDCALGTTALPRLQKHDESDEAAE